MIDEPDPGVSTGLPSPQWLLIIIFNVCLVRENSSLLLFSLRKKKKKRKITKRNKM